MKLYDEDIAKKEMENVREYVEEAIEEYYLEEKEEHEELVLTQELIEKWKKEHGKVFKNTMDGKDFYWRRLRRHEYIDAMQISSEETPKENVYLRQAFIAKTVTLFPSQKEMEILMEEYAGLAIEISDNVVEKSGFVASETEEV